VRRAQGLGRAARTRTAEEAAAAQQKLDNDLYEAYLKYAGSSRAGAAAVARGAVYSKSGGVGYQPASTVRRATAVDAGQRVRDAGTAAASYDFEGHRRAAAEEEERASDAVRLGKSSPRGNDGFVEPWAARPAWAPGRAGQSQKHVEAERAYAAAIRGHLAAGEEADHEAAKAAYHGQ
jgi:hypothetical protein